MPEGFSKPSSPNVTGKDLMSNPDIKRFLETGTPTVLAEPAAAMPPPPEPLKLNDDPLLDMPILPPENTKSPQEKYLEMLAKFSISKDSAAKIVDAMVTKGVYQEEIQVTRTLKVTYRTRDQAAADRLNSALNTENPQLAGVMYALVGKHNLASSLVQYGPYTFDPSTEDGFKKVQEYLRTRVPLPIYQLLLQKLSKFDEKMGVVLSEGVESFF